MFDLSIAARAARILFLCLGLAAAGCGGGSSGSNDGRDGGDGGDGGNNSGDKYEDKARAWGEATPLDAENPYKIDLALDADGNGFAVWGDSMGIKAQRYDATGGWAASAEVIDTGGWTEEPHLAFLPDGAAIAAWSDNPGDGGNRLTVKLYDPEAGWGETPTTMGDAYNYGSTVVADGAGNATVFWSDGNGFWVNRRQSTGNWDTHYQLGGGGLDDFVVAIDTEGNIMAVWGEDTSLWYSQYDAAGGAWSTTQLLDSVTDGYARSPSIGVDADGNYTVAWLRDDDTNYDVYARRWNAATSTWGDAEKLNGAGTYGWDPKVAVSANGTAVAVWEEYDDNIGEDVTSAAVYSAGSWSTTRIDDTGNAYDGTVAIDTQGNAIAMWIEEAPGEDNVIGIWTARHAAGSDQWEAPALLRSITELVYASDVELALRADPQGNFAALWAEGEALYTARYE